MDHYVYRLNLKPIEWKRMTQSPGKAFSGWAVLTFFSENEKKNVKRDVIFMKSIHLVWADQRVERGTKIGDENIMKKKRAT